MQSTKDSPFELVPAAGDGGQAAPQRKAEWAWPALRSTLLFLAVPATLALGIAIFEWQLPPWLLYGVAGALALVLLSRSISDPEWLFATFIIYIPLNRIYVAPIAPGINGTHALLLLLLVAWVVRSVREGRPLFVRMPGSRLVGVYALVTMFSAVTVILNLGSDLLADQSSEYVAWVDQFIIFFAFLNLIRDGATARRLLVYMMVGTFVVMAFGLQEMLDKQGASSIEESRVLGPQLQPNDFGAFLVYTLPPFVALLLVHMPRLRSWPLVPFLFVAVKLLLVTYSRGAYMGIALGGLVAGYLRGKLFLFSWIVAAIALLWAMPQFIPDALVDRMQQTAVEGGHSQELDASSQTRLVLWNAAIDMSLESPLFGKGFKSFPYLKSSYTEFEVREADNHNMYLYIASQMGLPALVLFLLILFRAYRNGACLYRRANDPFARVAGMGAATMVAGLAVVNMFGSRMVGLDVNAYFWIYLALLAHLVRETEAVSEPKGG